MAHAKLSDLKDLQYLLDQVRAIDLLKENSFGCFYYKRKGVLHFHIKGDHRYTHVFDGAGWKELKVKPAASVLEQTRLLRKIQKILGNILDKTR